MNKGYYSDEAVRAKLHMPYGAYGPYEKAFYDDRISYKDFSRLCREFNHGENMSIEELKEVGIEVKAEALGNAPSSPE